MKIKKFSKILNKNFYQKGFTLSELLIVIAVIGILSTVVVTLIDPITQMNKANDGKRKSDLAQIQTALELYRSTKGSYPSQSALSSCGTALTDGSVTFINKIPCDPQGGTYIYTAEPSGCSPTGTICIRYSLRACLRYIFDPQRDEVNGVSNPNTGCGNNQKSYTVFSP